LFAKVEPGDVLSKSAHVHFGRDDTGYFAQVPLPNASSDDLDVVVVDADLIITAGARRRFLSLPRRLARCSVRSAKLDAGRLTVHFGATANYEEGP